MLFLEGHDELKKCHNKNQDCPEDGIDHIEGK